MLVMARFSDGGPLLCDDDDPFVGCVDVSVTSFLRLNYLSFAFFLSFVSRVFYPLTHSHTLRLRSSSQSVAANPK